MWSCVTITNMTLGYLQKIMEVIQTYFFMEMKVVKVVQGAEKPLLLTFADKIMISIHYSLSSLPLVCLVPCPFSHCLMADIPFL